MLDWVVKYWVAIAFGAMTTLTTILWKKYKYLKKGIVALLFNSLRKNYEDYTSKGYLPIDALESITNIYETYAFFGGNGTGTKMYETLKSLPSKLQDTNLHEGGISDG